MAGALFAQSQGFADVSFGSGTIVIGLASLMIGEALLGGRKLSLDLLAFALKRGQRRGLGSALGARARQLFRERLVKEHRLTAIMITHHLADALALGNRTLLMRQGQLIHDINDKERQLLTPKDLLEYF